MPGNRWGKWGIFNPLRRAALPGAACDSPHPKDVSTAMKRLSVVALVALTLAACRPSPEQQAAEAKQALAERQVDFSAEAFLDKAAAGDAEAVALFVQAGMDPNAGERRALTVAAEAGQPEVVKVLLENGADPKAEDGEALNYAVVAGNVEVVKALLEGGADPNGGNGFPLFRAAATGNPEVVKALLDAGADPNGRNGRALEVAIEQGHTEVAELIRQAGGSGTPPPAAQ